VTIVSHHQKKVDDLFASLKAEIAPTEKRPLFKPAPPRLASSESEIDHRIAEELAMMRRRLEQLGDVLSREPVLLQRHGSSLQSIDLMMQQLGHLAAVIATADKAAAAEQVSLQELRQRLTRKPVRSILA
jgi:hypothetical protein